MVNLKTLLDNRTKALAAFPRPKDTRHWEAVPFDVDAWLSHYGLRLRPGYQLVAYCNASMGNCSSLLYAVPQGEPISTRPVPTSTDLSGPFKDPFVAWELASGASQEELSPPRPARALPDFMQAITGPDTIEAYLAASLLARDGLEIGAGWHGCNWLTHQILLESPFLSQERIRELLVLLLEFIKTTPIDLMDLLYRQVPDGYHVRQKYRQKLRRGKTPQVTGQDLVERIEWDQQNLLEAIRWADCIYYNEADYYQYRDQKPALPEELEQVRCLPKSGQQQWQQFEPLPQEWLQIEESGQRISITFFTHTGYGTERIVRQVAHFDRGDFHPALVEHTVAQGPGGYIH